MTNEIYYIDLFSGAGGTTTGVHSAGSKVLACVNHDQKAIESHRANHPACHHFIEDIRNFKVVQALEKMVKGVRRDNPNCVIVLWASLECTNFSNAKGGQSRNADSRTLANDLFMYLEHLRPEYLMIENVREFMAWGPLGNDGKPVSRLRGKDYIKWVDKVRSFGFKYDWRLLNAADYGSYQSRIRYFGQFAQDGMPISWPEPTHCKSPKKQNLFGSSLKKWNAVKDVLNLNDVGHSIFTRDKPLVENTLKRIYAGLEKFVRKSDHFTMRYNGGNHNEKVKTTEKPIGSLTTSNRHGLVFMVKNYSGAPEHKVIGVDAPAGTITCKDHHSLVMLTSYYGNGGAHGSDVPCPTVTTKDRFAKLHLQFLDNQYGNGQATSLCDPNGAVTTNPKQNLITAEPSCSKQFYLLNPQFNDKGRDIERPCFTLIAKTNKRPPYLIAAEEGMEIISDKPGDLPTMKKIKQFMRSNGIVDIKMRMLTIPELLQIQGFPFDYQLKGTKAERKKFIGNAVDVNVSRALAAANREGLNKQLERSA